MATVMAFRYFFERIAAEAGVRRRTNIPRCPRSCARPSPRARQRAALGNCRGKDRVEIAAATVGLTPDTRPRAAAFALACVTEGSAIEREPDGSWTLAQLSLPAGQSPFNCLRAFRQLTGVTPHQFILRVRLREAALRRPDGEGDRIALSSGSVTCQFQRRFPRIRRGAAQYRRNGG